MISRVFLVKAKPVLVIARHEDAIPFAKSKNRDEFTPFCLSCSVVLVLLEIVVPGIGSTSDAEHCAEAGGQALSCEWRNMRRGGG